MSTTYNTNQTIFFDDVGNILDTSTNSSFGAGNFIRFAPEATNIIISEKVTKLGGAFAGHENVRRVYVYNKETEDLVRKQLQYNNMKNYSDEVVLVNMINDPNETIAEIISMNNASEVYSNGCVLISDFVATAEETDDTGRIQRAIDSIMATGGKLIFDSYATYIIDKPIVINATVEEVEVGEEPLVRNFEIDFNNSTITVSYDDENKTEGEYGSKFEPSTIVIKDKNETEEDKNETEEDKNETEYDENKTEEELKIINKIANNCMIRVNNKYSYNKRIGVIRNLTLDPGLSFENEKYSPGVEAGIFLQSSTKVKYENITIKNTTTGIYHYEGVEVFFDNINLTKSSLLDLSDDDITTEIADSYNLCKNVGINCQDTDSHFSNINVENYLVGMKVLGGDNRVYNARVKSTSELNQHKSSVAFINGGVNYYTNCVVEECYIGWFMFWATALYMYKCEGSYSSLNPENQTDTVQNAIDHFMFYFGDKYCANYSGGGIYATNCLLNDSPVSKENIPLTFSNRENDCIHIQNISQNTTSEETNDE